MPTGNRPERDIVWTTSTPSIHDLQKLGYTIFDFARFHKDYIEPALHVTAKRTDLQNAAASALAVFRQNRAVAVLDVPVETLGDLQRVHDFVVEPAYRNDCALFLKATKDIDGLKPDQFVDPLFGYPWTLERLLYLVARYRRRSIDASLPPLTPIEEMLLSAMKAVGLKPRTQYGIGSYRADFAFPERLLLVEADGRGWHDVERDRQRDGRLADRGWKTVRFSGSRIWREAEVCAEEIARLYTSLPQAFEYSDIEHVEIRASLWKRLVDWLRRLFANRSESISSATAIQDEAGCSPPHSPWCDGLDAGQRAAVTAHEGVVQVVAPAGSGKTRVLVARARELVARGVPQERILCTTFNQATKRELRDKLQQAGVGNVSVHTFHSVGLRILKDEGCLRPKKILTGLSVSQWKRLARIAQDEIEGGVWIDAPEASEAVGNYKLGAMTTPGDAEGRANTLLEKTAARIFALYEKELEKLGQNDYDDLIILAVRLLQSDADVRRRWQKRWECVLVDEYQDIEPAQELLIQILAAPDDCLMVVGDEDQCIYTWRRADVERSVNLDKRYPGLERVVLSTCYRCPPQVVAASSCMIGVNGRRFPKEMFPLLERCDGGEGSIALHPIVVWDSAATRIAKSLGGHNPSQIVVLARTSRLLRTVALACLEAGTPFKANNKVLRLAESEQVLLAYLRLLSNSRDATSTDVDKVFRVPNRYLPKKNADDVVKRLRKGQTFPQAISSLSVEDWRRLQLTQAADLFDRLSHENDAEALVQALRTEGGLDKHYSDQERMSPHDQVEIEVLDSLLLESRDKTPKVLAEIIETKGRLLSNAVSNAQGIELTTIHGSKGREWDRVVLFGWNEDQIPHKRVLLQHQTNPELLEQAIEDERRLAYVAMTRAKGRLNFVYENGNESRFLKEAGLSNVNAARPNALVKGTIFKNQ